ncbi:hypothetical protein M501DRAFT_985251 [Patellaria atrata CBS 101060]|uniref:Altered inheritance of mitochondria protein 21 n=1 Tax=Patellaria atrata CBS 101060 TaxID=1346257 RepID=A0A9P4SK81_9PEZI|nr:hypothetical protein M501DRAFT_985251 [Patellaria atrata CBS 101060]
MPPIPPRPKRNVNRSISPNRHHFDRSPLNDPSFIYHPNQKRGDGLIHGHSNLSVADLPRRPPSVTLPSVGQEGSEYANIHESDTEKDSPPEQTKAISKDLPLYAPTASLPVSSAKSRIATVTRTDSDQAAAAGIGKATGGSDQGKKKRSGSSAGNSTRPPSLFKEGDDELGIPEIGLQVPMYKNAGDVQAPTPGPYDQNRTSGIGFFNNGSGTSVRHHGRTKSGREVFAGPPGSYGMHGHGHGHLSTDPFEQAWYEKHPDAFHKEKQGEYGPKISDGRKDWVLSSDDLNKLVHKGHGLGTAPETVGTPDEQIGYIASEQFAQRITTPRPRSGSVQKPRSSSTHAESPLRASFSANEMERKESRTSKAGSEYALESEVEDEDVIHVDPPSRRTSLYDPAASSSNLDLPSSNTPLEGSWIEDRSYGTPILAADEVAKHPPPEFLQPAVSPEEARRPYHLDGEASPGYSSQRRSNSRPNSRPGSIHGGTNELSRYHSHDEYNRTATPLHDVKEYEPLFPEDDEHPKKPQNAADKLKRPENFARHQFPSQDVWEDVAPSLQYTTTVDSPQLPDEEPAPVPEKQPPGRTFESPETEAERKNNVTKEDKESFLSDHTKKFAKGRFNKDVLGDMKGRPGMQHRFPSQDIWEDAPDHGQLVATVGEDEVTSPQSLIPEDTSGDTESYEAVPSAKALLKQPPVPARPAKEQKDTSPTEKKAPHIPGRPKPQIPTRPGKKTVEGEYASEPPAPKPKPTVPTKIGSKIASLKDGFMKDLNNRLQLGPQAPKSQEPAKEEQVEEKEKTPLSDARKGRAKGPQRRKPAASPSGLSHEFKPVPSFSISMPQTIFSINEEGEVEIPTDEKTPIAERKSFVSRSSEEDQPAPPANTINLLTPEMGPAGKSDLPTPNSERSDPLASSGLIPKSAEEQKPAAEESSSPSEKQTDEASIQTGELNISIPHEKGEKKDLSVYLDGRADKEGTVVVQDGVEHVGDEDGLGGIKKTGSGL